MNVRDFFAPCEIKKDVVISNRFTDENDQVTKFLIKSITEEENEVLKRASLGFDGQFNTQKYITKLVCACVESPNLNSCELQSFYGVLGEENLVKKMLLAGEFSKLVKNIQEICGFDEEIEESVDYLKN